MDYYLDDRLFKPFGDIGAKSINCSVTHPLNIINRLRSDVVVFCDEWVGGVL